MKQDKNVTRAIGVAGEWWVAGSLQLQGAEQGYRVSDVNIDDAGTDLLLLKCDSGKIIKTYEIQVKTARTTTKNRAYYRMLSLIKHGITNPDRIYIFIYAPKSVKYCWIFTEKEIIDKYQGLEKAKNISFSVVDDAKDIGSSNRCNPDELFLKVLAKLR